MPYSPYIPTMGGYNPMNTYMQPPAMPPAPQPLMQSGIVCRLVASKEEAATTQIPFDGNPYVFPNLTAGEIYVKQFNINTGNTDFSTYTRYVPEPITYATADDIAALRLEIAALSKKNAKKKAEVTEDDE